MESHGELQKEVHWRRQISGMKLENYYPLVYKKIEELGTKFSKAPAFDMKHMKKMENRPKRVNKKIKMRTIVRVH